MTVWQHHSTLEVPKIADILLIIGAQHAYLTHWKAVLSLAKLHVRHTLRLRAPVAQVTMQRPVKLVGSLGRVDTLHASSRLADVWSASTLCAVTWAVWKCC